MKIEHLIKAVNESQSNEDFAAMSKKADQIAANAKAKTAAPTDNTIAFPKQPGTTPSTTVAQPAGPSGLDRLKKVAGAVGSAMKTGAQAVAKNAPAVGQGISNVARGLGTAGTGIVKGAGDIASQAVGGATQAVGAGLGGVVHGYKAARGGQQFGGGGTAGTPSAPSASSTSAPSAATGNDELDQLKATLQTMDQRLRKAGI